MKRTFDMEQIIGSILSVGVLVSAACLVAGVFWQWKLTGNPQLTYALKGTNLFQFFWNDLIRLKMDGFHPPLMINLGIALLLMTPYLRVAASAVYFIFFERNAKYSFFTLFVFLVLTYSLSRP